MEPKKNKKQVRKKSLEMCKYIAHVYRQRREELGLTKEEVAKRINKPVSTVTKSENSLCIGLQEVFTIGRNVYGLDILTLLEEAEAHAQAVINQQDKADKEPTI